MPSTRLPARARALVDDAGQSAPTPLFIVFLATLAVVTVFSFRSGASLSATVQFLLLAGAVSVAALIVFGMLLLWSARAGHRAAHLAQLRPGATVVRATRAFAVPAAARASGMPTRYLPFGLTLVADDTGFEWWAGSAEHPVRLGRVRWEAVTEVTAAQMGVGGRARSGVRIVVDRGAGDQVELPFSVIGSGLGGLFTPAAAQLEELVATLRQRRASVHATL